MKFKSIIIALFSFGALFAIDAPQNLEAMGGDQQIDLMWDAVDGAASYKVYQVVEDGAGTGGGTGGGTGDCAGTVDWIADGYCDASNNNEDCDWDGGDCCESTCVDSTSYQCGEWNQDDADADGCWDNCQDPDNECGGAFTPDLQLCADTFTVSGSDPSIGDCYTDGSGYFWLQWDGGCAASAVTYSAGTDDLSAYGFTGGFWFSGFAEGVTETFIIDFDGVQGASEATTDCVTITCEEQGLVTCFNGTCAPTEADCPTPFFDCVGNEFAEETLAWVGDGLCDCIDASCPDGEVGYGLDLNCEEYDFDGGDCGGVLASESSGAKVITKPARFTDSNNLNSSLKAMFNNDTREEYILIGSTSDTLSLIHI